MKTVIQSLAFFITSVILNALVSIQVSSASGGTIAKGTFDTKPVNNAEIAIPPFPDNNPNNYRNLIIDNLNESYKRRDGHIRDEFIPNKYAEDYISTLPNGRNGTVTKKDSENLAKKVRDPNDVSEYFIMRQRIVAQTML